MSSRTKCLPLQLYLKFVYNNILNCINLQTIKLIRLMVELINFVALGILNSIIPFISHCSFNNYDFNVNKFNLRLRHRSEMHSSFNT